MKKVFLPLSLGLALAACSGTRSERDDDLLSKRENRYKDMESLIGDETLLFGPERAKREQGATGIGVNSYLWRATLDTLSFVPLKHVDPFGGVILSKWYVSPDHPNERLKVDVKILSRELRADGLQVSVFRQVRAGSQWQDAPASPETAKKLEDAILTKARELRIKAG
ncbi:MAG: DUF3576 domain-containing protein [Holosporales bacterium]